MRTRRHHLWTLALALWLITGCGGTPPPTDDGDTGPAAPTNVTTSAGIGYVAVSWHHAGDGVTGFAISRTSGAASGAVTRASQATVLGTVPAASRTYVDRSATPGGAYRYSVSSLGSGGASSTATPQTATSVAPEAGTFNPDPNRYLAVRVLDEQGQPMANAAVRFVSSVGNTLRSVSTDDDGVALLMDTSISWQPAAVLTGHLTVVPTWSDTTTRPRIVPFEGVTHPGTLEDDPRTGELFDVSMTVHHGGTIERAHVQLALPGPTWPRWATGFRASDSGVVEAQVAPGSYPIAVSAFLDDDSRFVVPNTPLTVTGPTSREIDTAAITGTSTLQVDVRTGVPGKANFCPFALDPDALGAETRSAYCGNATNFVLMAAAYRPSVNLDYADASGWWSYTFRGDAPYDLRPAGSTLQVAIGEALEAGIDTERSSYLPGEDVRVVGGLTDAYGHTVADIYRQGEEGGGTSVRATLTITDPTASVVHQDDDVRLWALFGPNSSWWYDLDADAAAGTYQLDVTFDTGPLFGVVDVTTDFEVTGP